MINNIKLNLDNELHKILILNNIYYDLNEIKKSTKLIAHKDTTLNHDFYFYNFTKNNKEHDKVNYQIMFSPTTNMKVVIKNIMPILSNQIIKDYDK